MTFQTRLLVAFIAAVLIPLVALALFVRSEMTQRLTSQYERQVTTLVEVIEEDLNLESESIAASLAALRKTIIDDNRFRRAAVDSAQGERRYLLDYAGNAMQLAGLSMLQIQDDTGRIISSGHFRNEYDRMDPDLPGLLASTPNGVALVMVRAPEAPFLALARVDSFAMANRKFTMVAGIKVDGQFLSRLARGNDLTISLVYPGGVLSSTPDHNTAGAEDLGETASSGEIVRNVDVPFLDTSRGQRATARFHLVRQLAELRMLRRSIDRWFIVAVTASGLLAVLLGSWLASRISRPLVELADKTSRIDLDRLDIDFATRRRDEIGALSELLGAMTERLRAGAARIKEAERRATVGELARQVNHDMKNGLIPIRNVFRHLVQTARDHPLKLPGVFQERQKTIDSSLSYLEGLASSYARLSPRGDRRPCDVNAIVRRVAGDMHRTDGMDFRLDLCEQAIVTGDPLALRRIVENLVANAIDSLESGRGTVSVVTTQDQGETGKPRVRISVSDTGVGMSEEQRAKAFNDFYTTKAGGTGLGLSIVRRLVMDLEGSVHVESDVGRGSCFTVDLPAAGEPASVQDGSSGKGEVET